MSNRLTILLPICAILLLPGCHRRVAAPAPAPFVATVNTGIRPVQPTISGDRGQSQPVTASRDDGKVIADDTIPEPPRELGITLTAEQRKPTEFTVRINLSKVNLGGLAIHGAAVGLSGKLEFSSEAGMRTPAAVLDAKAAGFRASGDYISYGDQSFPLTLFSTQERQTKAGPPPSFNDPFTNAGYGDFGAAGNTN